MGTGYPLSGIETAFGRRVGTARLQAASALVLVTVDKDLLALDGFQGIAIINRRILASNDCGAICQRTPPYRSRLDKRLTSRLVKGRLH
jgi:hypothetical protein